MPESLGVDVLLPAEIEQMRRNYAIQQILARQAMQPMQPMAYPVGMIGMQQPAKQETPLSKLVAMGLAGILAPYLLNNQSTAVRVASVPISAIGSGYLYDLLTPKNKITPNVQ